MIIYHTPSDERGSLLFEDWLIKVDTLNKTLEWRDHEVVRNLNKDERVRCERGMRKEYPGFKWLKHYRAIVNGDVSPVTIWATSKQAAKQIFDQLSVKYQYLEDFA